MSVTDPTGLAERIEAAVLATPGVRSVYRAGSLVSNLVGEGAVAIGISRVDEPLVAVRVADEGVVVEASLGIEYSASAVELLQDVRGALGKVLAEDGLGPVLLVLPMAFFLPGVASWSCVGVGGLGRVSWVWMGASWWGGRPDAERRIRRWRAGPRREASWDGR